MWGMANRCERGRFGLCVAVIYNFPMSLENQIGNRDNIPAKTTIEQMASANTYEQLLDCWAGLVGTLDKDLVENWGTLEFNIKNLYSTFSKPPFACDGIAKNIFENEDLLSKAAEMKIPKEFLLQTVRVGAVKDLQSRIEKSSKEPVRLYPDGTVSRVFREEVELGKLENQDEEIKRLRNLLSKVMDTPNMDGFTWANNEIKEISDTKRKEQAGAVEERNIQNEKSKEDAIRNIGEQMHTPEYHLSKAQADLLREDFANKLHLWKGILENSESGELRAYLDSFLEKDEDTELTPEFFENFKRFYQAYLDSHPNISGRSTLPLEIIDPSSGWFSAVLINKQTNLRNFVTSIYGNMGQWFQL